MPTNKKESLQFGFMMCFGMVLVMTIYNLCLNGSITKISFIEGVYNFLIAFVIAFILDMFIVGPNAKKVALKITANTEVKIYKVLSISISMVLGMAFCMSIYGLLSNYIHNGYNSNSFIVDFLVIFGKNLIVALPLQIIVMGPLVRYIFLTFVKGNNVTAEQ